MTKPEQATLDIEYYQTNVGVFFKVKPTNYYNNSLKTFADEIDGVKVEDIPVINGYYKIDKIPDKIIKIKPGETKVVGYKLNFPEMQCDKIPAYIPASEVEMGYFTDEDDEDVYGVIGKYKNLIQFYSKEFVVCLDQKVEVELKSTKLGDLIIDNFERPEKMQIKLKTEGYHGNKSTTFTDLASIVHYDDFDRLFTPEFMLHVRPCKLTSHQVYQIVRSYILENINPKVAVVTSNYDFCFTVKKKVKTEPFITRVVKSLGTTRRPTTYKNTTVEEKEIQIFEMTYEGYGGKAKGYDGYTAIDEWKANSLKEMQNKIKTYLEDLISVINSEVEECKHCKGFGVHTKVADTNDRKLSKD